MANLFSQVTHGRWLDVWYHFAIMFEALFILTTLDAGTRVGRYLLQDALGHLWKPLGDVRSTAAGALASALIVAGWGWFLIQGVRDPLGGINSLWPLFGIANQLLAAIALVLATTLLLKHSLARRESPAIACVALMPLIWLLAVTGTAGFQKIFHPSPRIGFLATVRDLDQKYPALQRAAESAPEDAAVQKALRANRSRRLNNALDVGVTAVFLALAGLIVTGAVVEWIRLLRGRRPRIERGCAGVASGIGVGRRDPSHRLGRNFCPGPSPAAQLVGTRRRGPHGPSTRGECLTKTPVTSGVDSPARSG